MNLEEAKEVMDTREKHPLDIRVQALETLLLDALNAPTVCTHPREDIEAYAGESEVRPGVFTAVPNYQCKTCGLHFGEHNPYPGWIYSGTPTV